MDGLLHEARENDTPAMVALRYGVEISPILEFEANDLQVATEPIAIGRVILVPGAVVTPPPVLPDDLPLLVLNVIAMVQDGDVDGLMALAELTSRACTTADGLGGPPKCEDGDHDGTVYEVFPVAGCEGAWTRDPRPVFEFMTADPGHPYAVAQLGAPPEWAITEDYPYGSLVIVFSAANPALPIGASAIYLDDEGIVRVQSGCRTDTQFLQTGAGEQPMQMLWQ